MSNSSLFDNLIRSRYFAGVFAVFLGGGDVTWINIDLWGFLIHEEFIPVTECYLYSCHFFVSLEQFWLREKKVEMTYFFSKFFVLFFILGTELEIKHCQKCFLHDLVLKKFGT